MLALLAERAARHPVPRPGPAPRHRPRRPLRTAYLRSDALPGDAALGYLAPPTDDCAPTSCTCRSWAVATAASTPPPPTCERCGRRWTTAGWWPRRPGRRCAGTAAPTRKRRLRPRLLARRRRRLPHRLGHRGIVPVPAPVRPGATWSVLGNTTKAAWPVVPAARRAAAGAGLTSGHGREQGPKRTAFWAGEQRGTRGARRPRNQRGGPRKKVTHEMKALVYRRSRPEGLGRGPRSRRSRTRPT